MAHEYRRFWISSSETSELERLLAEAFEAGAEGAEQDERDGRPRACLYARADRVEALRRLLAEKASPSTRIDADEALPDVDWSEAWKEGLDALVVSERLVVRPPFVGHALRPGQQEIVIDPGQAFGTGQHASTRLCLEWLDVLCPVAGAGPAPDRLLDVGTGSGVLALAGLRLGVGAAVGFDLDPVAIREARRAARDNGLAGAARFFVGPIAALGEAAGRFPLVVANLLKSELLPLVEPLTERLAPEGRLVLAGLLEEDALEVLAAFAARGLGEAAPSRRLEDPTGVWLAPCLERSRRGDPAR